MKWQRMHRTENMGKRRAAVRILSVCMVFVLVGMYLQPLTVKAASGYLVKINKQANCVTIYKANASGDYKAVKAMVCSTGYATKLGTYSLGEKLRWHVLDGPCYGQYCTRIYGGVLFHSVWYSNQNDPSSLSISSYNKLGTTASHGCVRLTVADAKWIYDNVPSGTKVVIYSDSNPGPLGKPVAIKLPYTYAWDPTDTGNPNNPWNSKKPSITGVKNQTVEYNSKFDVMKGVKATNTTGFDAKALVETQVKYRGEAVDEVDTTMPGTYKVKYVLIDEIGRKATASAKIKVTAPKETPVISGAQDVYVTAKSKLTKSFLLKNVSVQQEGKKLPNKYISITKKKVKTNVYKVTYLAARASVPAEVSIKAYIDKEAPVISGITDGATYQMDASVVINKTSARSLIQKVSDNYTKVKKSDVKITLTELEDGTGYQAVYTLKDAAGNKTTVTVYLISVDFVKIEGPEELNLTTEELGCDSDASSTKIMEALRVYIFEQAGYRVVTSDNQDISSELVLELTEKENGEYQAILSVEDSAGHTTSLTVWITVERT